MTSDQKALKLAMRRIQNFQRESRRQQNMTRMLHIYTFEPQYKETSRNSAEYLGHMRVPVRDPFRQVDQFNG